MSCAIGQTANILSYMQGTIRCPQPITNQSLCSGSGGCGGCGSGSGQQSTHLDGVPQVVEHLHQLQGDLEPVVRHVGATSAFVLLAYITRRAAEVSTPGFISI